MIHLAAFWGGQIFLLALSLRLTWQQSLNEALWRAAAMGFVGYCLFWLAYGWSKSPSREYFVAQAPLTLAAGLVVGLVGATFFAGVTVAVFLVRRRLNQKGGNPKHDRAV